MTILFSMIFTFPSYGEWVKVAKINSGDDLYVNLEEIRIQKQIRYAWRLSNYIEPMEGYLSSKVYLKVDCELFRYKKLSASFHKQPMGKGEGRVFDISQYPEHTVWYYPSPNAGDHFIVKSICNHTK